MTKSTFVTTHKLSDYKFLKPSLETIISIVENGEHMRNSAVSGH